MATYKAVLLWVLAPLILWGQVIKPQEPRQSREILLIQGKRRIYHFTKNKELVYQVHGPATLKLYSRAVALSRKGDSEVSYSFEVTVDQSPPRQIKHQTRLSGIRSSQHPNHRYTRASLDYFQVGDGVHTIRVRRKESPGPLLFRLVKHSQGKKSRRRLKAQILAPADTAYILIGQKRLPYFKVTPEKPLLLEVEGPKTIELLSRLALEYWMNGAQDYRLQIRDNGRLVGTYHYSTTSSDTATVEGHEELVPGKWRTCRLQLKSGSHRLKISLLDSNRQVFVRFFEETTSSRGKKQK